MDGSRVLPPELQKISDDACAYVKAHKREIIARFAGEAFPTAERPVSIFMAGSPGAGKTEFSKLLVQDLGGTHGSNAIIRIDGDEIRDLLPGYTGANAFLFQRAISIGVSKLHDDVLKKRKNFILDGTFSHIIQARENVQRSLKAGREVLVVYLYQDPLVSWEFTKKREAAEGRNIPRDVFIERFFAARETVRRVKEEFGQRVDLWLIERNLETGQFITSPHITDIDSKVNIPYTKNQLMEILPL